MWSELHVCVYMFVCVGAAGSGVCVTRRATLWMNTLQRAEQVSGLVSKRLKPSYLYSERSGPEEEEVTPSSRLPPGTNQTRPVSFLISLQNKNKEIQPD